MAQHEQRESPSRTPTGSIGSDLREADVGHALKDIVDQVLDGENPDDLRLIKDQLKRLEREVQNRRKDGMVSKAMELERIALREGFSSLSDAARCLNGARKRGGEASIYVNPDDPEQIWEGRGRRPNWINDHLRAGRNLSEMIAPARKTPGPGA